MGRIFAAQLLAVREAWLFGSSNSTTKVFHPYKRDAANGYYELLTEQQALVLAAREKLTLVRWKG